MRSDSNLNVLYREKVSAGEIHDDPKQRFVIEKLQLLVQYLQKNPKGEGSFFRAVFGWGREKIEEGDAKGLYIYGSVGRGKSMLMEMFATMIGESVWRVHFYDFMQFIHKSLDEARKSSAKNPLDVVIDKLASHYRVLCLDEMQIENIADAMIVGRLFEGLFARRMILVTTSNRHPSKLYENGLNRHRFTPFIEIVSQACEIISLDGPEDYRQNQNMETRYFYPLEGSSRDLFDQAWSEVGPEIGPMVLEFDKRSFVLPHCTRDACKISFEELCVKARGVRDYQELCKKFHIIFIEDVPFLTSQNTSAASRFIALIDVLYEVKTPAFILMAAPPSQIHKDKNTSFIWERTYSRLMEMSKPEWGRVPPSPSSQD